MFGLAKWKVWVSILVCAWGLLYAAPNLLPAQDAAKIPEYLPHKQVSLGLDLRGGCYLLLEVDVAQVMRERLTNLLDGVRTAARTQRIAITNLAITGAD